MKGTIPCPGCGLDIYANEWMCAQCMHDLMDQPLAPQCEECGCEGNFSCGKEEPPHGGCELDMAGVCPCCGGGV